MPPVLSGGRRVVWCSYSAASCRRFPVVDEAQEDTRFLVQREGRRVIPLHDPAESDQSPLQRILRGSAKSFAGVLVLVLAIVVTGIIVQRYIDVDGLRVRVEGLGVLAPLVVVSVVAVRNMLVLPILPMALLIGIGSLVFGKFSGACYIWVGTTLGAILAFMLARYCIGDVASRLSSRVLRSLNEVVSSSGPLSILGLRLAFYTRTPLNYGCGLTSVSLGEYAVATLIGLAPRTFILSYLFERVQDPDLVQALLAYPSLILLHLLLVLKIGGIGLLTLLVWRARKTLIANPEKV